MNNRTYKKESRILAQKIYEIEHADANQWYFWCKEEVKSWIIAQDIRLELSEDYMMFYLWKRFPDQARAFFKAVPKMRYDVDQIESILKAQAWICI